MRTDQALNNEGLDNMKNMKKALLATRFAQFYIEHTNYVVNIYLPLIGKTNNESWLFKIGPINSHSLHLNSRNVNEKAGAVICMAASMYMYADCEAMEKGNNKALSKLSFSHEQNQLAILN